MVKIFRLREQKELRAVLVKISSITRHKLDRGDIEQDSPRIGIVVP